MSDGRRSVLVEVPGHPDGSMPAWRYRLAPVDDEATSWQQIDDLGVWMAWRRFEAEWLDRTRRYPLSVLGVSTRGWLIDPGFVESLAPEDPVRHAMDCRDAVRVLRCLRVVYLWWADVVRWNAGVQLLEAGWLGSDAELWVVVNGIVG